MLPRIPRLLALLLMAVALSADAQKTTDAQQPKETTATGSISGMVVDASDGAPIKGANIFLSGGEESEGRRRPRRQSSSSSTRSAADGTFTLENIAPGRYSIDVQKPGYSGVRTKTQKRPTRGMSITVAVDQKLTGQELQLVPSATIVGRVVDEEGSPLQNLRVEARQWKFENGKRRLAEAGTGGMMLAMTNDLGEYRMFSLLPGRYYLVVNPWWNADSPEGRLLKTYYTGSRSFENATPIVLGPGDEVRADMTLAHFPGVRVRGALTGEMVESKQGGFMVQIKGEDDANPVWVPVEPNGSFEANSITPGVYDVVVSNYEYGESTGPKEISRLRIEVPAGGLDNLTIPVAPTPPDKGELAGTISSTDKDFRPGGFFIVLEKSDAQPDDEGFFGSSAFAASKADGTFKMSAPQAGNYYARVMRQMGPGASSDLIVDSIEFNGRDYTNKPLPLSASSTGTLRITMTTKSAAIEGTVSDSEGKPAAQAQVMLMPSDGNKRPDLYESGQSDQNGRFKIRGIVPGTYNVIALSDLDSDAAADPNFVKTIGSRGTPVRLEAGTPQSIALKVTTDLSQQ